MNWLRKLGLEQYESTFRDNHITAAVLPELTAGDLKEIGVGPVGHRRRMIGAIATLRQGAALSAGAPHPDMSENASAAAYADSAEPDAERRQLTVMFCDLVGSTALSARLDPEDLREIIGAYHRRCAEVVSGFGGFVAKYMGDGVLAYFGYPRAQENDAEGAVRAALALTEAVGRLQTHEPLRLRIGIGTGLVVVGDLLGSGESQERGVGGEAPNVAARLQVIAEPNAVVIAQSTRKLIGNLFEFRDLDNVEAKGFAAPMRA